MHFLLNSNVTHDPSKEVAKFKSSEVITKHDKLFFPQNLHEEIISMPGYCFIIYAYMQGVGGWDKGVKNI
jgi:hypothetical protein